MKEKKRKPKTKAKKAIVNDHGTTEPSSPEPEIYLLEFLDGLRKDLPLPEAISDEQIKSWLDKEGASSREGNTNAYFIGWTLAARLKGISHGHQTAWLKSQEATYGRSTRLLQLYMQVARGIDTLPKSKSATALRISVLDTPLRDIPKALMVAAGKAPKTTPETSAPPAEAVWKKWNKKLSGLLEEAHNDAVLRAAALPALESAFTSLTRGAGTPHSTTNPTPERSLTLRKKDLTTVLSRLPILKSNGVLLLRVTRQGDDGEVEIVAGNDFALVGVPVPAFVGNLAPDRLFVSRAFLQNLLKTITRSSGTVEFVVDEKDQLVAYYGRGKYPLKSIDLRQADGWPVIQKREESDDVWPAQEFATILHVAQVLRQARSQLRTTALCDFLAFGPTLAVASLRGDDAVVVGQVGTQTNTVLHGQMVPALLSMLDGTQEVIASGDPHRFVVNTSQCFGMVVSSKSRAALHLPTAVSEDDAWVCLPTARLRTGVRGLGRGVTPKDKVLLFEYDEGGKLMVRRVATERGDMANWGVPVLETGGSSKWKGVGCWHSYLDAVLSVWPCYQIRLGYVSAEKGDFDQIVLSTPEGFSPYLKIVLPQVLER